MQRYAWCFGVFLLLTPIARAQTQPKPDDEFFETQIRPLLSANCFSCHGPKKQEAGLRLDSREAVLKGSENGVVVDVKNPEKSLVLQVLHYDGDVKMPPKGRLSEDAVRSIAAWIKNGLYWPAIAPTRASADADAIALSRKTHWSFRPVVKPAQPAVKDAGWTRTPVDRFILAALEAKGMQPSARADRRTLLRRATFDLLGLPPTPDEMAAFLNDAAPGAWERAVERLLASPRYGECWGRHWLDVARYADTKGYVFTEERRFPSAYTYRDYVIRAFNEDLPYDRFVVEQIAADRLPSSGDKKPLAALGYLTLGRRFLNNQHDIIDDRIDVVCRGMMGLTVSCARCHDHKFDPIPTKDYYSLYGVFASSTEPGELPIIGSVSDAAAFAQFEKELKSRQDKVKEFVDSQYTELIAGYRVRAGEYLVAATKPAGPGEEGRRGPLTAGELQPQVIRRWRTFLSDKARTSDPIWAPWSQLAATAEKDFPDKLKGFLAEAKSASALNPKVKGMLASRAPRSRQELAQCYVMLLGEAEKRWQGELQWARETNQAQPEALGDAGWEAIRQQLYGPAAPPTVARADIERHFTVAARDKRTALQKQVQLWQATSPAAPPRAMVLQDLPSPVQPRVLVRGNPGNPGPEVPRQFLQVLSEHRQPFHEGSGRLELARAIASGDNPLTARVMANRIWMYHFGAGLVRTPGDFGTRGEPPTNAGLLDYLAATFVEHGWSVKQLQRLILCSNTYQQASEDRPTYAALDPDDRLLWRQNLRRLDFEGMRDSLLAASGNLRTTMGGPAVDITAAKSSPRRSVYGFIDRQNLPGLFRTFDLASPDVSTPQRHATTVPQQALFLLNSPFVLEQAAQLVRRPEVIASHCAEERIECLHRILYGRAAEAREMEAGIRFVLGAGMTGRAWESYAQVLLLANEFVFVD
jgi:mono/diheme cytochrome c family protein